MTDSRDASRDHPLARRQHVGAATEVVGQDYVLHDATTGKVHFLNTTAALVWDLCDGTRSLDELCAEVARQFDRDPDSVRDDVVAVLARFTDERLLLPPDAR